MAEAVTDLKVSRRNKSERRTVAERRETETVVPEAEERRGEGRRKVERRRQIDPTTCERDYSENEIEFMRAMDVYKRKSGRQFPTWSEVLEVISSLGYRQVAETTEIYPHNK